MDASIRSSARLRSFRTQSALQHEVLVTLLAVALPALFAVMLSTQQHRDEALALNVVAQNVARTLAAGLQERSHQVEALARDAGLWSGGLSSPAVRRALAQAHTATPHSSWLGVVNPQGTVQAGTGGLLEGASVAERPWFRAGLQGSFVGDVHDAVLLAKLLPPRTGSDPLRFVDFASPIVVDGRLLGVLGQHGSWAWARSVVALMAPLKAEALGLEILIFDHAHKLIYAPEGTAPPALPAALVDADTARDDNALVATWGDGVEYLIAASRMHLPTDARAGNQHWTVVVREPTAVAFASARRSVVLATWVGALGAALAAALAWGVAGRLSRPLSRLAAAARDVEASVAGAAIPIDTSNREIAGLSTALSGMTLKLQQGRDELEALVQERTLALQAANAELHSLARHDPLTGLMNRRAFDERLQQAVARARRTGGPLSLLMVDADHFKRVNDQCGHDTGDAVLKALATLLRARLRETDCVARLGGEEFALLLPATDADGALRLAQDLVQRAAAWRHPDAGVVTVSVGVASTTEPAGAAVPDAGPRLLRQADQALYAAKRSGRNRALVHSDKVMPAMA